MDRFLRRAEVERIVGLKRSAIYDRMARDQFPRPVRLAGSRAVRWQQSKVAAWMKAQHQQGAGDSRKKRATTMDRENETERRGSDTRRDRLEGVKSVNSGAAPERRPPIRADSDAQDSGEAPKAKKRR